MKERQIIILDTSAFIAGFDPFLVEGDQCSVPMVEKELVLNSLPWMRFKTAVDHGRITLKAPSTESLDKIKEVTKKIGDIRILSAVDLQILALAFEQKIAGYNPLIVTDDYSIQNVANKIGVDFSSLITFGIRFRLHWTWYCPACYRIHPPDYENSKCEVCGTKLKRKPLKKTHINTTKSASVKQT